MRDENAASARGPRIQSAGATMATIARVRGRTIRPTPDSIQPIAADRGGGAVGGGGDGDGDGDGDGGD